MKAKKYKKKPIVIEAINFDESPTDIMNFIGNSFPANCSWDRNGYLEISTLEGVMKAGPGDYIIKGINGEFYPCKHDIFLKTYEEVNESPKVISGGYVPCDFCREFVEKVCQDCYLCDDCIVIDDCETCADKY